jgi:hypothetical protein
MFRTLHTRRGSAGTIVIVVLVLALIAGGLWYFVMRSTPEKTVRGMLEAARIEDRARMKEFMTDRETQGPPIVMTLTLRLVGDGVGEPKYTIGEPEISENLAEVPVQFPLEGAFSTVTGIETFTMPYVLHREGQAWLVDIPDTREELARQAASGVMDGIRRFVLPGGALGGAGAPQT